jgi:hypothetical protein
MWMRFFGKTLREMRSSQVVCSMLWMASTIFSRLTCVYLGSGNGLVTEYLMGCPQCLEILALVDDARGAGVPQHGAVGVLFEPSPNGLAVLVLGGVFHGGEQEGVGLAVFDVLPVVGQCIEQPLGHGHVPVLGLSFLQTFNVDGLAQGIDVLHPQVHHLGNAQPAVHHEQGDDTVLHVALSQQQFLHTGRKHLEAIGEESVFHVAAFRTAPHHQAEKSSGFCSRYLSKWDVR